MNRSYNPKVSIIIPAFNASNYLKEAIESAIGQTYKNLEVIVVNDGSDDNGATASIAKTFGDRIRYIEKENGGSSSALNAGIHAMTGDWFSWLSHDDLYYPTKIEKQIDYLSKKEIDGVDKYVLFCGSEHIDKSGNTIKKANKKKLINMGLYLEGNHDNKELVINLPKHTFHGCGCLIHKNVFKKIGGFDESFRLINDLDMWYRIYKENYKIRLISDVLVQGRIHPQQISKEIGFSYHNPEQDLFWKRSLEWLRENYPNENNLFILFGKNAFLKTRYKEGNQAFEFVQNKGIALKCRLCFLKVVCCLYSSCRQILKKFYVVIKVR